MIYDRPRRTFAAQDLLCGRIIAIETGPFPAEVRVDPILYGKVNVTRFRPEEVALCLGVRVRDGEGDYGDTVISLLLDDGVVVTDITWLGDVERLLREGEVTFPRRSERWRLLR